MRLRSSLRSSRRLTLRSSSPPPLDSMPPYLPAPESVRHHPNSNQACLGIGLVSPLPVPASASRCSRRPRLPAVPASSGRSQPLPKPDSMAPALNIRIGHDSTYPALAPSRTALLHDSDSASDVSSPQLLPETPLDFSRRLRPPYGLRKIPLQPRASVSTSASSRCPRSPRRSLPAASSSGLRLSLLLRRPPPDFASASGIRARIGLGTPVGLGPLHQPRTLASASAPRSQGGEDAETVMAWLFSSTFSLPSPFHMAAALVDG